MQLWRAFHQLNPFPHEQVLDAISQLTAICHNFFNAFGKGGSAKSPSKFRLNYRKLFRKALKEMERDTEEKKTKRMSEERYKHLDAMFRRLAMLHQPKPGQEVPYYVRHFNFINQGKS